MAKKKTSKKTVATTSNPPISKKKSNVPDFIIQKGFWKKNNLPALLLFVFSIALYLQSYNYDFVLDDKIVYHQNSEVKKGFSGIKEIMTTESMVGYFGQRIDQLQGGRYRPLSIVTFAMEHELFGNSSYKWEDFSQKAFLNNASLASYTDNLMKNPQIYEVKYSDEESFLAALATVIPQQTLDQHKEEILHDAGYSNSGLSHIINAILYGLLVLVLFRVLSMIFPLTHSSWYLGLAFVATLLFALHPTHVEVVANVKGRDEIMALLGALGAMYFTLKYIATEKPIHLVASGIVFLIGLFSKENAMTFMAVIPLTTYFFTKTSIRKNAISIAPLAISFLIFLWMRKNAVGANHIFDFGGEAAKDLMNNPFVEMNGAEKSATIFYTLGYYLKLLIFPHPLTHDYYPYQIPIMNWGNISSILSLLAHVGLVIYAVMGLRKKSILSYGILFYLITLSVVSNLLITTGTFMNERFLFFSSIGFCIVVAYFISRKLPAPVLNVGLLAILVLGFSAKTFTRTPAWKDGFALNSSGVKNSPNSARANLYMSTSIYKQFYNKETDTNKKAEYLDQAALFVDRALEIHNEYKSALTMKVILSVEQHRINSNINRLLNTFEMVLKARGQNKGQGVDNNIDAYLNHYKKRGYFTKELLPWSHRVGYDFFLKEMGDYPVAKKYIDYGLSLDPTDYKLQAADEELKRLMSAQGGIGQ